MRIASVTHASPCRQLARICRFVGSIDSVTLLLLQNRVDRSKGGRTYPEFLSPDENFVVPDSFLAVLDMDEGTLVSFMLMLQ